MGRLVVSGIFAAIGYYIGGPAGAALGWSLGSMLGSYLFPVELPDVQGPRVQDLGASTSTYGVPITRLWGTYGLSGNMIWSTDLIEVVHKDEFSGKGGPTQDIYSYTYRVSSAYALCEGPVDAIRRIWFDSELVYDARDSNLGVVVKEGLTLRLYNGYEEQEPDPLIQSIEGVDDTPAYRGICYLIFQNLPLAEYGNRRPNVRAEVVKSANVVNPSEIYSIESHSELGYDRTMRMVWHQEGTEMRVYDAQSMTLISTWITPPTPSVGGRQSSINGSNNGVIYMAGWITLNTMDVIAYDLVTGQQIGIPIIPGATISDPEGIVVSEDHMFALDHYMLMAEFFGTDFWLYRYALDGTLINMGQLPIGLDFPFVTDQPHMFTNEPGEDGAIWYTGGDISGNHYIGVITFEANPFYPHESNIPWLPTNDVINMANVFGSQGQVLLDQDDETTNVGDDEDNFHYLSGGLWYDPGTQSIIVNVSSNGGGLFLEEGVYRLECSVRHDLKTMRIVARNTSGADIGSPPAGDIGASGNGLAGRWGPLLGNGLMWYINWLETTYYISELRTIDLSLKRYIQYSLPNFLNGPKVIDYESKTLWSSGIGQTPGRYLWDRWPLGTTPLDNVVEELCAEHGLVPAEIDASDLATKTVRGLAIARATRGRTIIEILMGAYQFDAVESDKKILFRLKDRTSMVTVPEADLAAHEPGTKQPDDLVLKRKELYQLPHTIQVTYMSESMEYEPAAQYSRQPTSPATDILKIEFPLVLTDDEAAQVAEIWMQSIRTERHIGAIELGPKYFEYDPTDIITVNRGGRDTQMRLLKTSHGGLPGLIKADVSTYEPEAYVSDAQGAAPDGYFASSLNIAPLTAFFMIDSPPLRDTDDDGGFYAVFSPYTEPTAWPGGVLARRPADDTSEDFTNIEQYTRETYVGTEALRVVLPDAGKATVWDWVNSINVMLWNSRPLSSESEIDVLNGANAVFFPHSGELMQFQVATLEIDGSYTLTGLLRGRKGTEWAMDEHLPNEPVCFITPQTTYKVDGQLSDINRTMTYAAVTFNSSVTRARKQNWTQTGNLVRPLTPVQLTANRESNDDLTLTWIRRARLNADWLDDVDVPLDEPTEEYDVELYQGIVLMRTQRVVGGTTFVYTAAMQSTDTGGDLIGDFNFCVYQISNRVGRGRGECFIPINETISTNFDQQTPLEDPTNWVHIGNIPAGEWKVYEQAPGDNYLSTFRGSGGRTTLQWLRGKSARDVEVVCRMRTHLGIGSSVYGIAVRVDPITGDGILAGFNSKEGHPSIIEWTGGYGGTLRYVNNGESGITVDDIWWYVRLRVQGDTLKVKFWNGEHDDESNAWQFSGTQTYRPDAGDVRLVGAYDHFSGPEDFDFVSIAYDGRTAPTEV